MDQALSRPADKPDAAEPSADAADVEAARSGDRAAFSRLYRRYATMIHAVLISAVGRSDADDLVQEVFLRAMARLGELREPGAFGGWLVTIARRQGASHLRTRRRADPMTDRVDEASARSDDGQAGQAEAHEALAAIASLPEAYRETLLMRLVEGMTGPEIAARTGMTHGSVRVNLHRGMMLLRERLSGTTEGGPKR